MKSEPDQESSTDSSEAPKLEMHKRVVRMSDGKRDMIYFTFEEKHVGA
jgi:hypothetical protein